MKNGKAIKGFTLIELIIILALVSVIAFLSVSFYSRFLLQNEVENTTERLVGQIRKAQLYSMMNKGNSSWGVKVASGNITLFSGGSYATRNSSLDESFTFNNNISILGLSETVFKYRTGTPSAVFTVTISGNNNTKTISINSQGRISK